MDMGGTEMDMGGMDMSHDHAGHDHSAHAAPAMTGMEHDHGAVLRRADGSYYYTHGAFTGHIVPGTFFMLWGLWWLLATYHTFLTSPTTRQGFKSRAWYKCWFGSSKLRAFPLEPLVKIVLPFFGILGELWLGHGPRYMALHKPDGKFDVDNMNDWQHSAMYSAFITSGIVDLLGWKLGVPQNTEHAFLTLAFLSEGLLLGFHLKGPDVEWMLHFILVLQIFATVVALILEMAKPRNVVVASLRPMLTIVQGVWWIQTAYFMYKSIPAWDPEYMGSAMFTPVVLVVDLLVVSFLTLLVFLGMQWFYGRVLGIVPGHHVAFTPLKSHNEDDEERGGSLEMASLRDHDEDSNEKFQPIYTLK